MKPFLALLLLIALAATARAEGVLERAEGLEASGEAPAAADLYLEAWKRDPASKEAGLGLARCVLAGERDDLLRQAEVTLAALLHNDEGDLDLRRALGQVLLAQIEDETSENLVRVLAHRARSTLRRVVEERPEDAIAVRLLARAIDLSGEPNVAIETIDGWLELGRTAPPELVYEKGRILYEAAVREHAKAGGGYPLPEAVRRDLARARDLFYAATVAMPEDFDAWIHLAWAAQRLGEFEDASLGYERALLLEPESLLPLRGLHALHANDPEALDAVLRRLLAEHEEARRVLVYQAWRKFEAGDVEEAEALLVLFIAEIPEDAEALALLGRIRADRGEDAEDLFWRALAADPGHLGAAEGIDRSIRRGALALAKQGREGLSAIVGRYERLIEAAPENPYVRNNLAFLLREAWGANQDDPDRDEVLEMSAEQYDAAVSIIGRCTRERVQTIPWSRRYAYAQIVCDAGVLRHNFEPVEDLVRAEFCYRQALDWTEGGYLDAWTYLSQMYRSQQRFEELRALALRCAEGLANEAGEPLEAQREAARALATRIEAEGQG